jgi:multidrug resistance efflux pump
MMRKWLFYMVLMGTGFVLLFYSNIKQDKSYAVVAEVESQKTAISFHKPVRVKELNVQPGAHVKKGDLLLVVERADLELDIQKVENELVLLDNQLSELEVRFAANRKLDDLKTNQRISELDLKIRITTEKNRKDSIFYDQIVTNKSTSTTKVAPDQFLLESLQKEKIMTMQASEAEIKRSHAINISEKESVLLKKEGLQTELSSLQAEQESLRQIAPFDGTIGAVSVQLMELVPPYQTIISVYDEHPNIIKGYMNERAEIIARVGQKVSVTSSNRNYKIEGEVIEVGSRIVSFPRQMNPVEQMPLWGREVFVKITKENEFLNGEKVYVIFEKD